MTKERMITRTIDVTEFTFMLCDIEFARVDTCTHLYYGTPTTDSVALLQSMFDSEKYKVVTVLSEKKHTELLGMTEQKFIEYATILPPRKRKESDE